MTALSSPEVKNSAIYTRRSIPWERFGTGHDEQMRILVDGENEGFVEPIAGLGYHPDLNSSMMIQSPLEYLACRRK